MKRCFSEILRGCILSLALAVFPFSLNLEAKNINNGFSICDDVTDPPTLDPQKQFSEKNHNIVKQIYEGLLQLGSEGQIEPLLAYKWERVNPLTMRFYLRDGVKFHNGEDFNASAVSYSISRYLDPKVGFPGLGFINSISSSTVVDDHTIDIHTKFPDGLLLNRLAGFVLIVPPVYFETNNTETLTSSPVGTGPFKFVNWVNGRYIRLSRNENYWQKGYPVASEVTFKFIPYENQIDSFLSGKVDILTELPGTATTLIKTNGHNIFKKDSFYTLASNFNTSRGPLRDKRVRQALNYAINKEELIRYDLLGNGLVLASLGMKGEEGFNPNLTPYDFNFEKAKSLLKEAGFEGGFKLKGFVKHTGKRAAGIIKAHWKRIGVELTYEVKNEGEFINEVKTADLDLAFGGSPDPMGHTFFIQSICFYSQSPYSIAEDPQLDKLLIEMVTTIDDGKRATLSKSLDKYIHDNALGIFTYQRIKTYAVRKGIMFTPYASGMPTLLSTGYQKHD